LVNNAQRGAIAARDAHEGGGKLAAGGVCVHSVPPDRDPIALPFGAINAAPCKGSAGPKMSHISAGPSSPGSRSSVRTAGG
jgi:hypothetical protein